MRRDTPYMHQTMHSTGMARDRMTVAELEWIEHPSYKSDRAPCDFFLFGRGKGKSVGTQYQTPEDFISEVSTIIEGIHADALKNVVESWKARLLDCWNSGGEYGE
jgi:hypothetical protein